MPREPRRWLQFGLRSLLLLVLLLCLGHGILVHRANQHRRRIAELHAIGVEVQVSTPPALPQWLRSLVGDDLLGASFSVCVTGGLNDEQLRRINELPKVEQVMLSYAHSEVYGKVRSDMQAIKRELPTVQQAVVVKGDR